ncbi:hypothetical protein ACHMW4_14465 [Mesorhizobium sp. UC22_110]|uniref:hypothetical protein n=1 Tax=unclassified Mesorhizobium TaxID=325217 RepID=UPI00366F22D0
MTAVDKSVAVPLLIPATDEPVIAVQSFGGHDERQIVDACAEEMKGRAHGRFRQVVRSISWPCDMISSERRRFLLFKLRFGDVP